MDLDRVYAAARDLDDVDEAVAHVHPEHEEHFLLQPGDPRLEVTRDIRRARQRLAPRARLECATPELERGRDSRRACRADAGQLRELVARRARQRGHSTELGQELRGERAPASGDDREQILVGHGAQSSNPRARIAMLRARTLTRARVRTADSAAGIRTDAC